MRLCRSGAVAPNAIIEVETVHSFVAPVGLAVLVQAIPVNPSISSFMRYDATVEVPVDDGCFYEARIVGTLTPVYSRSEQREEVEPDFDISANLVCPRAGRVNVRERLAHTGPLARERVETLISQRATIIHENVDRRCLVIPSIRFRGESLVGTDVETHCTRLSW